MIELLDYDWSIQPTTSGEEKTFMVILHQKYRGSSCLSTTRDKPLNMWFKKCHSTNYVEKNKQTNNLVYAVNNSQHSSLWTHKKMAADQKYFIFSICFPNPGWKRPCFERQVSNTHLSLCENKGIFHDIKTELRARAGGKWNRLGSIALKECRRSARGRKGCD